MKNKKKKIIIWVIIIVVILAGILIARVVWPGCLGCKNKIDLPTNKTGLPNPASVHCEEVGGTLDIRTGPDGGQTGYCTLPDKSVCEEWALLRNQCTDTI